MKRLNWKFTIIAFVISASSMEKTVAQSKNGSTKVVASVLPADLRKLFFENARFTQGLWFQLPNESSLARFNEISSHPEIKASNGSSFPSTSLTMTQSNDIDKIVEYLMSFFVHSGYMKIESRTQTTRGDNGSNSNTYNFLFYSSEFKKFARNSAIMEGFNSVTRPFVLLAHRNLVSIDYKNEYEDAPFGMKRQFYSIVFSYNLVNDLPNLPIIPKVYQGKAKAFKDPDDGTWKTTGSFEHLGIELNDRDNNEVSEFLKTKYEPYKFEGIKSGGNSSKDNKVNTGSGSAIPNGLPATGNMANIINGDWLGEEVKSIKMGLKSLML